MHKLLTMTKFVPKLDKKISNFYYTTAKSLVNTKTFPLKKRLLELTFVDPTKYLRSKVAILTTRRAGADNSHLSDCFQTVKDTNASIKFISKNQLEPLTRAACNVLLAPLKAPDSKLVTFCP